jgi:DNA primase
LLTKGNTPSRIDTVNHESRVTPGDFYTGSVLPALAEQLDRVFPEFGWRRDKRGWVATNQDTTHRLLGVRADRVVAHRHAPQGFLVHGAQAVLWTAYVNGGRVPRGEEFVRIVKELAQRANVDATALGYPGLHQRRAELLRSFSELCRDELMGDRGVAARAYLERRGLPGEAVGRSGLGLVPAEKRTSEALERAGYQEAEVAAAGVLADSRWAGRLCGPWRNQQGQIGTLWARTLETKPTREPRYLYLRGARRSLLPPYGLWDVLAHSIEARRDLVLVEGVFDLHQLRMHGVTNAAALGGLSIAPGVFERLSDLGVERVTLCLDRDAPGRSASARAVEQSGRARRSPAMFVVDGERMRPHGDPDSFIRAGGIDAWTALLAGRACGVSWRALEFTADVGPDSSLDERRECLTRAGAWLGSLPPRLSLEQEDAIKAVAERSGYSSAAVQRTFRARYWNAHQPSHPRSTR